MMYIALQNVCDLVMYDNARYIIAFFIFIIDINIRIPRNSHETLVIKNLNMNPNTERTLPT